MMSLFSYRFPLTLLFLFRCRFRFRFLFPFLFLFRIPVSGFSRRPSQTLFIGGYITSVTQSNCKHVTRGSLVCLSVGIRIALDCFVPQEETTCQYMRHNSLPMFLRCLWCNCIIDNKYY